MSLFKIKIGDLIMSQYTFHRKDTIPVLIKLVRESNETLGFNEVSSPFKTKITLCCINDDLYQIIDGHHRCAALYFSGYVYLPDDSYEFVDKRTPLRGTLESKLRNLFN